MVKSVKSKLVVMRKVKEAFLGYPHNFPREYRKLRSFFLELFDLVPDDINLNIVVNNQTAVKEIRQEINRDFNPIIITGYNDIWLRDYMGFVVDDYVVKPNYKPDYLPTFNTPRHIANCNRWAEEILGVAGIEVKELELIWDGGNLVTDGKVGYISDNILSDNPKYSKMQIEDIVREILKIDPIIVPCHKHDLMGHIDGNLSALEEGVFCINSYDQCRYYKEEGQYIEQLKSIVTSNGTRTIELYDYLFNETFESENGDYLPSANGCYVNFWKLNNTIILPEYKVPRSSKVELNELNRYILSDEGYEVKTIDCTELAALGGVLHCISWEV